MPLDKQEVLENLFLRAHQAMSQRQPDQARKLLDTAIKIDCSQAKLWHLLADTRMATGGIADSISTLKSALRNHEFSAADRISLQIHLATKYVKSDELGAATECLDQNAITELGEPTLAARAGFLLAICEEHSAALKTFESALKSDPNNPELIFNTAAAHRSMGNLEKSEALYDQLLNLSPESYPAYWLRSSLRKQTEDRNHVAQLEKLAAQDKTPTEGKVHLYFSLAKELEDLKQFRKSFSALEKGATLKKKSLEYDVTQDLAAINTIRSTYDAHTITQKTDSENSNGEGIIFILGMPRTGSTLVDRILSSHETVDSAGEPDTFAQIFYRSAMELTGVRDLSSESQMRTIKNSSSMDFEKIGRIYQEKLTLRAKQKNSQHIIDKNPSNFLYLGAIKLALPQAKIIHIRRNPLDTCYAIYKTLFKKGHPYSYDLEDLAAYYGAYDQLMNHWSTVFDHGYYELTYEDLVTQPTETSQKLMQYCGLGWSEKCLDFHQNDQKGTATASAAQVRRPIYINSLNLWGNYAQELTGLSNSLKEKGVI
ncbi:tetratricopeptide repeat-containing sulfotransferase family protein [Microbulbifer sp.]|uniref:tetratricopeptide repeat-containing sulfotransferase family protein n=1 Tax=Microbulbifer sp. TaxID=1908541 RepID=UPI002585326F|nr:tetratricopeptide repeat-containing sulfotransferase family protein [Microbulbifer sp.]